jgi:hypothetical protein
VAFRLTSLNKLTDTKSNDNKTTLLDFVAQYMIKNGTYTDAAHRLHFYIQLSIGKHVMLKHCCLFL